MRTKISDSSIDTYSNVPDAVFDTVPGEAQTIKRRSGLYKCRSVEDFSTSSSYEVRASYMHSSKAALTHLSGTALIYCRRNRYSRPR